MNVSCRFPWHFASRYAGRKTLASSLIVATVVAAAGCATAPTSLQPVPDPPVAFAAAIEAQKAGQKTDVVWGGQVVEVENRADTTRLTIAKRALDFRFAPADDARTEGRFLADLEGFVDPTDFPAGARVTIRGRVEALETLRVGEAERTAPVVRVAGFQRFPDVTQMVVDDPFLWHRRGFHRDPFWPNRWRSWPPF